MNALFLPVNDGDEVQQPQPRPQQQDGHGQRQAHVAQRLLRHRTVAHEPQAGDQAGGGRDGGVGEVAMADDGRGVRRGGRGRLRHHHHGGGRRQGRRAHDDVGPTPQTPSWSHNNAAH